MHKPQFLPQALIRITSPAISASVVLDGTSSQYVIRSSGGVSPERKGFSSWAQSGAARSKAGRRI